MHPSDTHSNISSSRKPSLTSQAASGTSSGLPIPTLPTLGNHYLVFRSFPQVPQPKSWSTSFLKVRMKLFSSLLCLQHHPAQGRCSRNGLTINHSGVSVWEEGQVWALQHQHRAGGVLGRMVPGQIMGYKTEVGQTSGPHLCGSATAAQLQ